MNRLLPTIGGFHLAISLRLPDLYRQVVPTAWRIYRYIYPRWRGGVRPPKFGGNKRTRYKSRAESECARPAQFLRDADLHTNTEAPIVVSLY